MRKSQKPRQDTQAASEFFAFFAQNARAHDIGSDIEPSDWDLDSLPDFDFDLDGLCRELQTWDQWVAEAEQSGDEAVQEALPADSSPMLTEEEMRERLRAQLQSALAQLHDYELQHGPLVPLRKGGRVRRRSPEVLRLRYVKRQLMDCGLWTADPSRGAP